MRIFGFNSKLIVSIFAAALAMVFAASASAVSLKQVKKRGFVRVAIANEIPYGYMDSSGKAEGAGPKVAEHVLHEMGIKDIQWVVTQFGSLIPGLKAGRFDLVAAEMAVRPERCKQVDYSAPNTTYGQGLLVAKGNPDNIHSFSDFAKGSNKIAIMAGADQLNMLQDLGVPEGNMVTISSNADAISTVSTGRAAAYAATGLTASNLAKKSDKVELAEPFHDPIVKGKEQRDWGAFAFAKDSQSLRNAFNKVLMKYKKTQAWKDTLAKYGFTPTDIEASSKKTTKELCSGE